MIIPLFMIKEGEKYGYPEREGMVAEKISIIGSLRLTLKNRIFVNWTLVNCCTFFGLQMFLSAMNGMIIGSMGFNGLEMAIANTCAFAPVPVMLYLFNKLKAKKGIRFTYQSCLLMFAVAIMSFFFASTYVCGDNKILQYVISFSGSFCGSWSIGAFFMMSYLAAAQISSVEIELT
jgi:Na+/melibiose symporter-like transporter